MREIVFLMFVFIVLDSSSISSFTAYPGPSSIRTARSQNEPINSRVVPQQALPSVSGRSPLDQRVTSSFQNSLHVLGNTPTSSTITPRHSATVFSETTSMKQPPEQQSAFRRPVPEQDNHLRSQSQVISQTPQRSMVNGYQEQSSILSRPSMLSDSYTRMPIVGRKMV